MGYSSSPNQLAKSYTPTDAIIIAHDATATKTAPAGTWELKKSILITAVINTKSLFRFNFDIRATAGGYTVYGQIRRNGAVIGTEQSTGSITFITFTEDISSTNWVKGDSIELWLKGTAVSGVSSRNFRLCGLGSEFELGV